jgi:hypothetical protein
MRHTFAWAAFVLILCTSKTFAVGTLGPGLYQLHDHGFADLGPNYGLRVDGLGIIFSADLGGADVTLFWDGGATATISGQLHNNITTDLWDVDYTLTGVVADGHRIPGDNDSAVGRGWMLPPNSVDDWLVTAELIPEPASLALLASGGVLLLNRRRS